MALALKPKVTYTPEEYLALEDLADQKSEYCQGEIFAMAGGSTNHNRIAVSLCASLDTLLEDGRCEVFSSDVKLFVVAHDLYTYPDAMVVCGGPQYVEERDDALINPTVIVEVLSKTTRGYASNQKFAFYRSIQTFQDYVLIDQERVHVDCYHKEANGRWVLTEYNALENQLLIESLQVAIPLRRIYRRVDWLTPAAQI